MNAIIAGAAILTAWAGYSVGEIVGRRRGLRQAAQVHADVADVTAHVAAAQHAHPSAAKPSQPIEDMPGHPEKVRELADVADWQTYWGLAEQLLDGGLADVAENLGWME